MKFIAFSVLATLAVVQVSAQPYFQQVVNYRISATLDDNAHRLSGEVEIEYTNNAPQPLGEIWMHLWGNAFGSQNTAFAKQKLRSGDTKFYFAKDTDRGFYTGLDFSVNNQKASWAIDRENPDIAVVTLPEPLASGGKTTIRTPFQLQIPASFSRLGHVGESYQMTQWYPKPAVFDAKGWHAMPYLDLGEFYAEFGNYEVTITLPENYVVGATGVLQDERERQFLEQKIAATKAIAEKGFDEKDTAFPPSSPNLKTIRYKAEQVHDFAWFADKRFHVLKDVAVLPSGKQVDAWAMFTNEQADIWQKGAAYVKRAVEFYSQHVGEYPWPQATAVHSALSAGGGMEYPMITVIGNSGNAQSLDDVITHEVGHNWFYGILASNEREHAWMDEGMNSYYEYRYMNQYYGQRSDIGLPAFLTKSMDMDFYELGYAYQARRRLDQAPETTSNGFTDINYGLSAYVKPGTAFGHLEKYLSTESFDKAMKAYFDEWKFRHPYPSDLRTVLERETGKELGWFFDGYIGSSKHLDYALAGIEKAPTGDGYLLRVENRGEIAAPFPVSGLKGGEVVETKWYEGSAERQQVPFPACDCDRFVLDAGHATLDLFRKNNTLKTTGLLKTVEPVQLRLLGGIENSRRTTLNVLPVLGWNHYDGAMLGLLLHNGVVPARRLEWRAAPMYGLESNSLAGTANVQYNFFPVSEKIRKIAIGASGKLFHYRQAGPLITADGTPMFTDLQYRRAVPFVSVELMRSPTSQFYQKIQFRTVLLSEQVPGFEQDSVGFFYTGNAWGGRAIHELSWELGDRRVLNPYSLRLALEQSSYDDIFDPSIGQQYMRLSVELKQEWSYDRKRSVYLRVFAGGFLKNDSEERGFIAPGAYNLTAQGFNDYRYDGTYLGRTEATGFWSQQVSLQEGGMKVPLGSPFSEGRSNKFIFAVNLKADLPQDLPLKLPLKPYFDFGYFNDNRPISSDLAFEDQVWWQGGFALEFGKGALGVYFPAISSKLLRGDDKLPGLYDTSGRDTFWERISFSIDFARLNPWSLTENIQL